MKKEIILLFTINILSAIGYSLIAPLYPSIAIKKGLSEYAIGIIFSCFSISNIIFIPLSPKFIKHYGRRQLLYIALITEVMNFFLFLVFRNNSICVSKIYR